MGTQLRQEEWDSLVEFSDAGVVFTHQLRLTSVQIVIGQDNQGGLRVSLARRTDNMRRGCRNVITAEGF
jgi:hypothetical protein